MALRKTRNLLMAVALGAIPLGTVSTCDYSGGQGAFFYDQGGDGGYFHGGGRPYDDGVILIEEEIIEEEVYIEEVYYDDCGFWDGCYWDGWLL